MFQFCSQCGTVYLKGVAHQCANECCQGTHEWSGSTLEDVKDAGADTQGSVGSSEVSDG